MQALMETIFDVLYLSTVITMGILLLRKAKGQRQFLLFGLMAILLGVGDAFHLIPRMWALNTTGLAMHAPALGFGKFVTSISMTIFYVILYFVWYLRYDIKGNKFCTATICGLAVLRVVLCFLPQNNWLSPTPPLSWAIYRNVPFLIIGLIIIFLFYTSAKQKQDKTFAHMWLAISLSFAFYIPVVLWAGNYPLVGLLMMPKTCAYVWVVFMGYKDLIS